MEKWEYKIIICKRNIGFFSDYKWDKDMQSLLPGLGEEGWELVNMVAECSAWGDNNSGVTTEEKWVFKRPKS